MSQVNPKSRPCAAETRKLQVVEPPRKPAKSSCVPREVRDAVVRQIRVHGRGPLEVARREGITLREAVDFLLEQLESEKRTAYQQGYRVGAMNPWGPLPPASRAA